MLSKIKNLNQQSVVEFNSYKLLKKAIDDGIKEIQVQGIVNIINSLDKSKYQEYIDILIDLATFKTDVEWYKLIDGSNCFIGWKEIGAPIRLSAIKLLGEFGSPKALAVLNVALLDTGDKNTEVGEVQWYVYRNGDDIRKEAENAIKKIKKAMTGCCKIRKYLFFHEKEKIEQKFSFGNIQRIKNICGNFTNMV